MRDAWSKCEWSFFGINNLVIRERISGPRTERVELGSNCDSNKVWGMLVVYFKFGGSGNVICNRGCGSVDGVGPIWFCRVITKKL